MGELVAIVLDWLKDSAVAWCAVLTIVLIVVYRSFVSQLEKKASTESLSSISKKQDKLSERLDYMDGKLVERLDSLLERTDDKAYLLSDKISGLDSRISLLEGRMSSGGFSQKVRQEDAIDNDLTGIPSTNVQININNRDDGRC